MLPLLVTKSSLDFCKLQAMAAMTNTMPTQVQVLHGPVDTTRQTLGIIALTIGFSMIAIAITLHFIQRRQQAHDYQHNMASYYPLVNDDPSQESKPKPVAIARRLAPAPGWQPDHLLDLSHVEDDIYAARLANFVPHSDTEHSPGFELDPADIAELRPDDQLSAEEAEKLHLRVQSHLAQQAVKNSTDPWEETALWHKPTGRNANAIDF